ncbi:hypothetical protein [Dactylosporangium cerinum]
MRVSQARAAVNSGGKSIGGRAAIGIVADFPPVWFVVQLCGLLQEQFGGLASAVVLHVGGEAGVGGAGQQRGEQVYERFGSQVGQGPEA